MSDFLPFSRPAMGAEELAAVKTVLDSGWITTGPKNQELEAAFCRLTGNQYAVAVSSATAGMHIALMALGIGEGDEVITPSKQLSPSTTLARPPIWTLFTLLASVMAFQ